MSVKIKKNNITMTRGDTVRVPIDITDDDGVSYIPTEGDVVRFAAKKAYSDEAPCILKDIPLDTLELHIEPSDTKNLEQPCTLVYDVEITLTDGTVDTFMEGKINITEEVY